MGLDRALNVLVPIFYRDIGEGEKEYNSACWLFIGLVTGVALT
jgi:hypothetical protein